MADTIVLVQSPIQQLVITSPGPQGPSGSGGGGGSDPTKLAILSNLSDLNSASAARTNLGLGTAATQNTGAFDTAGLAAAVQTNLNTHTGNVSNPHSTTAAQAGALAILSNLSDLNSASAARTNLGLGTAATQNTGAFDAAGAATAVQTNLNTHTANTTNPHATTAAQAGAYTTAQTDTLLNAKSPIASPTFTGVVTAPSFVGPLTGNASGLSANITESQVTNLVSDLALKSPIASPTFTGVVTAPSFVGPLTGNASGLSANIAESQVTNLVSDLAAHTASITANTTAIGTKLPLAGGTLTGNVTGPNLIRTLSVTWDGNGTALVAGAKLWLRIPVDGTIVASVLIGDVNGSCVLAVKKCAFASYPGSVASIVASAPPTLAAAQTVLDTTLTGWTVTVSAGDVIEFSITSVSTITRLVASLDIKLR